MPPPKRVAAIDMTIDSISGSPTASVHALHGETMGTTWSVKLVAASRADLHALHAGVQRQLDLVVAQMSTWEKDSDLCRFNRAAAGTWQPLPEASFSVLSCALETARESTGAYDPTLGPLVDAWGFGANAQDRRVPDPSALAIARERVGWSRLQLRPDGTALQPGAVELDLSAIAKGFAVDLVARSLRDREVKAALVEVGGELYGYGRKPDGSPWQVLVETSSEDETEQDEPCVLALDGIAVATSGDRWHVFEQSGEHYSHTIDPRTGRPVQHAAAAVTVIADEAMRADAWATALTVMGSTEGLAFAQARHLAARFVTRSGSGDVVAMTDAFRLHAAAS